MTINLDNFAKGKRFLVLEGVVGQSVIGPKIKLSGNVQGTSQGMEGGKVIIDFGPTYHAYVLYSPEDLKVPEKSDRRNYSVEVIKV